jgi:SnoaL-like domain
VNIERETEVMEANTRREIEHDVVSVVARLAQLGDHKEAARAVELFTVEGSWKRGGTDYVGRDQLLESYGKVSPETAVVRHCVLGTVVTIEDESHAAAVTYYCAFRYDDDTVTHKLPVPLEMPFAMGEWHDRFEKPADEWQIARRETARFFQRRA